MNRALRVAALLLVAFVVLYVLFTWVFPWVESRTQDPTVGAPPRPPSVISAPR